MSDVDLPEVVDRWESSGGTWRVSSVRHASADVELLRCDGGEVVETLTVNDPVGLAWARQQFAPDAAAGASGVGGVA